MQTARTLVAALFASLALFLSGCSESTKPIADNHDLIAKDAMAQVERAASALSAVKDKASAEKFVEELKTVAAELKKIGERSKALGKPSKEQTEKMNAMVTAKTEELKTKMAGTVANLKAMGPDASLVMAKGGLDLAKVIKELATIY